MSRYNIYSSQIEGLVLSHGPISRNSMVSPFLLWLITHPSLSRLAATYIGLIFGVSWLACDKPNAPREVK